jgi:hypothetical protein
MSAIISPFPSFQIVTPPESGGVFVTGAENGNTADFSGIYQTNGTFTASQTQKYLGSWSYKAVTTNNATQQAFARKNLPAANTYYARCYVYIDSTTAGPNSGYETLLNLRSGTQVGSALYLNYNGSGVPYRWCFTVLIPDYYSTTNFSMNAWHCIEILVTIGGGANSIHKCWIDATLVFDYSNGTQTEQLERVLVGPQGDAGDNSTVLIYFDNAKIDTSYIGLYP